MKRDAYTSALRFIVFNRFTFRSTLFYKGKKSRVSCSEKISMKTDHFPPNGKDIKVINMTAQTTINQYIKIIYRFIICL